MVNLDAALTASVSGALRVALRFDDDGSDVTAEAAAAAADAAYEDQLGAVGAAKTVDGVDFRPLTGGAVRVAACFLPHALTAEPATGGGGATDAADAADAGGVAVYAATAAARDDAVAQPGTLFAHVMDARVSSGDGSEGACYPRF